jgi:hypothetical protein
MKDQFSRRSDCYSRYRPQYPAALFEFILSHTSHRDVAWDCATGNGQAAAELSRYFKKVYATDISAQQLAHAKKITNVIYLEEPAEHSTLPDHVVNLVTIAQALHWVDTEGFYSEVRRVAAPGAVIAAWTYGLLRIDPLVNELVDAFHFVTLGPYWDEARKHVDDGYASIDFPFTKIEAPGFEIKVNWSLNELEGYFNTWSGLQQYLKQHQSNPIPLLIDQIKERLHDPSHFQVCFPLTLKMGHIHQA